MDMELKLAKQHLQVISLENKNNKLKLKFSDYCALEKKFLLERDTNYKLLSELDKRSEIIEEQRVLICNLLRANQSFPT